MVKDIRGRLTTAQILAGLKKLELYLARWVVQWGMGTRH